MKIDLNFDVDTLRITNSDEQSEEAGPGSVSRGSQIINDLKRNSTVGEFQKAQPKEGFDPFNPAPNAGRDNPTEGMIVKPSAAKVESTKLRQLLNNLPENL
jgi:hypothetical protein